MGCMRTRPARSMGTPEPPPRDKPRDIGTMELCTLDPTHVGTRSRPRVRLTRTRLGAKPRPCPSKPGP
jgi:hypothetical protein